MFAVWAGCFIAFYAIKRVYATLPKAIQINQVEFRLTFWTFSIKANRSIRDRLIAHFLALHQYQASTLLQYSQNTHHNTHDEMN
jgi:sensor domain CHASE-containing protein